MLKQVDENRWFSGYMLTYFSSRDVLSLSTSTCLDQ